MENLNNDQIEQAKDLLKRLTRLYGEKADLEIRLKDLSEKIKFEIADSCDLKNKQGEVQASRVKWPLVMAAINDIYKRAPSKRGNKFELLVSEMEDYKQALEDEDAVSEDLISMLPPVLDELDAYKGYFKDVLADASLLDQDTIKAIEMIAKDKYKEMKADRLIKAGYETKEPKDNSELFELKERLNDILA